jgi:peroxiredoxin
MRFLKNCRWLLALFTTLLLVACEQGGQPPSAGSGARAAVGSPAPDFTLTDLQGQKVTLSQFRGKVILVNFWATWCPPCREEMPSMEELFRRFQDQGLVMLAVNIEEDGERTVPRFLQGKDYSFPILLDPGTTAQNLYQVFRFPETFVIDRNGTIVDRVIGGRDWMSGTLVKRINFLLNG